jgi:hypothetical protein
LRSLSFSQLAAKRAGSPPGSSTPTATRPAAFDPISREGAAAGIREWNSAANAESRAFIASRGYNEAHVSVWAVDHPAAGASGYGCSYLFEDDKTYETFDGTWVGPEPGVELR